MLNEVLCVYVISRVHCAVGCLSVLLLLLLLYCALRAHVRRRRCTNTLLHYIMVCLHYITLWCVYITLRYYYRAKIL